MKALTRRAELLPSFTRFDQAVDEMFRDVWNAMVDNPFADSVKRSAYPKCDITIDDQQAVIEAAIPGLNKEDITVEYDPESGCVVISGKKQEERKESSEKGSYEYRELHRSQFSRSIFISRQEFDVDNIVATEDKHILRIVIKKKPVDDSQQVKKIEIT